MKGGGGFLARFEALMDLTWSNQAFLIGCNAESQARVRQRANTGNALRAGIIA
jgi:hypothetical protein